MAAKDCRESPCAVNSSGGYAVKKAKEPCTSPAPRRSTWRRIRRFALIAALAVVATTWLCQSHVVWSTESRVHPIPAVPSAECILVPGARIFSDGSPYPMLVDRLAAALELFQLGKAPRILVSGRGGGGVSVDEVAAMRGWLEQRNVPADAIVDDPLGLRTLDSLRRCREVYGFPSAIVVSNGFHVPRMVFLGVHFGLDVHGVAAPALYRYTASTLWKNRGREVLARVKACVDVYVLD